MNVSCLAHFSCSVSALYNRLSGVIDRRQIVFCVQRCPSGINGGSRILISSVLSIFTPWLPLCVLFVCGPLCLLPCSLLLCCHFC